MSTHRIGFAAIATFALLFMVGCQSSNTPAAQATAAPRQAVVISGGQGGGTVVYLPSADPDKPLMLSTTGAENCPDCQAAAVKYFKTGQIDPKCSKCGATRTVTSSTLTNVGHQ